MPGLENYRALVERVDAMCARTVDQFAPHILCRAGCDACCLHLSIFAVEAAAVKEALKELSPEERHLLRAAAVDAAPDSPCPLLHDSICLLYRARPIICRTHGLPLLLRREDGNSIDFCPENFQGVENIPGSAVIDLERLNALLATINTLYLQEFPGSERLTVAEAITSHD